MSQLFWTWSISMLILEIQHKLMQNIIEIMHLQIDHRDPMSPVDVSGTSTVLALMNPGLAG
jgi:hypothetical protein